MIRQRCLHIAGFILLICFISLYPNSLVAAAPAFTGFSYQGFLEDGGVPANGTYDLRFGLWDDSSEGNLIALEYMLEVSVDDGLFAVDLEFPGLIVDDTALWLEVEIKGPGDPDYTALSPRQAITAVLYAHYAEQAESAEYVLNIPTHDHWGESWSGSGVGLDLASSNSSALSSESQADDGIAIYAAANGAGQSIGVSGSSDGSSGQGVAGYANSSTGFARGVYGFSASSSGFGVFGFAPSTGNHGVGGESQAVDGRGVTGTAWLMDGTGVNYGVYGRSNSPDGYGGFFVNVDLTDEAVLLAANDAESTVDLEFKVTNNGNVYADGTYSSPAADFAEMLPAAAGLAPGDVLVIDSEGKLTRSSTAYQSTVLGVYSTQPGFLGGAAEGEDHDQKIPLAVLGVVPVKASAENGAIQPGDLLVAADTPGHAMRAGENPPVGTVLGKALESLDEGWGVIQLLVMLQ